VDARGLYDTRFDAADRAAKAALWEVLCRDFFQRYVPADGTLIDLGAGFGEFVNHIRCRERWAVDIDPGIRDLVADGVQVHVGSADDLGWRADDSVEVVFASNVFEHFPSKDRVFASFGEVRRVLRPGGRFLILQPNIRFAYREYWDFFDHHLPFSDRAMAEGLMTSGFRIESIRPRFLPYASKSWLPRWPALVRLYLHVPLAHRLLGKQMFIVATKPEGTVAPR
jgi:SAM-dependent methyltransferase